MEPFPIEPTQDKEPAGREKAPSGALSIGFTASAALMGIINEMKTATKDNEQGAVENEK